MGLPDCWNRVQEWIDFLDFVPKFKPETGSTKLKNPEIPKLTDYGIKPGCKFWEKFPFKDLPKVAVSRIIVSRIESEMSKKCDVLTLDQVRRCMTAIRALKNGADACQKIKLPPCVQPNAKSTVEFGEAVTDTVATWVKKGFAAGPFDAPPVDAFRVNCLMAIPQESKVRPVLNASLPEGKSLNSNVVDEKVEKVQMCSARCFSYSVIDAGRGAFMAKMDMEDAYKNVPCRPEDFRLQGFSWLSKFFVETRQIFGAKTAVSNFDILGKTVLDLVLTDCKIPKHLVHRQLDDVPVVVPFHKKFWCEEFVEKYRNFCNEANIGLAQHDKNLEKAFDPSQEGKVLGIIFDTKDLLWQYPMNKKEKTLTALADFLESQEMDLKPMQKLLGRLNDICLMCPFLKTFKGPMNDLLSKLQNSDGKNVNIPVQCKRDARVFAGFLLDQNPWVPIAHRPMGIPIRHMEFVSDAAGFTQSSTREELRGAGSIGFNCKGEICFAKRLFWPAELTKQYDEGGVSFGDRTLFLEMCGLLIPFITAPHLVKNNHVVLKVDNLGCYFAWENKNVSNDKFASIIVRTIVFISAYLECNIVVEHLPRMSSWEAKLCDRISREKTIQSDDRKLLSLYDHLTIPFQFYDWLKNPNKGWDICNVLLEVVKNKM